MKKYLDDDEYTYYVLFRHGYQDFIPFFKKSMSLHEWFIKCKDYCVTRTKISINEIEISVRFTDVDGRVEFCDKFGPLHDSFYNDDIYSEYAKQFAKKFIK